MFHLARNDEEELVENLALHDDEVQVKEEHDLIDPLEVGDQFFLADNRNSYSEAASVDRAEGEEMDGLIDGEEDDTAFCIIPSSQKRSRESPRYVLKKPKLLILFIQEVVDT